MQPNGNGTVTDDTNYGMGTTQSEIRDRTTVSRDVGFVLGRNKNLSFTDQKDARQKLNNMSTRRVKALGDE